MTTAQAMPVIPDTPAAQAEYMARLADAIEARVEGRVECMHLGNIPTALIDICRAVAIIGEGVARAEAAYAAGLRDGARGRHLTSSPA
jgi:hypothetical protein